MAANATDLVIFDCDGVLVDSEPISISVLVEALAAAGVAMSEAEAHERFLGRSLKSMSEILHDDYGLAVDAAFLETMRKALYARFLESQKYSQTDPWAERAAGKQAEEFVPLNAEPRPEPVAELAS